MDETAKKLHRGDRDVAFRMAKEVVEGRGKNDYHEGDVYVMSSSPGLFELQRKVERKNIKSQIPYYGHLVLLTIEHDRRLISGNTDMSIGEGRFVNTLLMHLDIDCRWGEGRGFHFDDLHWKCYPKSSTPYPYERFIVPGHRYTDRQKWIMDVLASHMDRFRPHT